MNDSTQGPSQSDWSPHLPPAPENYAQNHFPKLCTFEWNVQSVFTYAFQLDVAKGKEYRLTRLSQDGDKAQRFLKGVLYGIETENAVVQLYAFNESTIYLSFEKQEHAFKAQALWSGRISPSNAIANVTLYPLYAPEPVTAMSHRFDLLHDVHFQSKYTEIYDTLSIPGKIYSLLIRTPHSYRHGLPKNLREVVVRHYTNGAFSGSVEILAQMKEICAAKNDPWSLKNILQWRVDQELPPDAYNGATTTNSNQSPDPGENPHNNESTITQINAPLTTGIARRGYRPKYDEALHAKSQGLLAEGTVGMRSNRERKRDRKEARDKAFRSMIAEHPEEDAAEGSGTWEMGLERQDGLFNAGHGGIASDLGMPEPATAFPQQRSGPYDLGNPASQYVGDDFARLQETDVFPDYVDADDDLPVGAEAGWNEREVEVESEAFDGAGIDSRTGDLAPGEDESEIYMDQLFLPQLFLKYGTSAWPDTLSQLPQSCWACGKSSDHGNGSVGMFALGQEEVGEAGENAGMNGIEVVYRASGAMVGQLQSTEPGMQHVVGGGGDGRDRLIVDIDC